MTPNEKFYYELGVLQGWTAGRSDIPTRILDAISHLKEHGVAGNSEIDAINHRLDELDKIGELIVVLADSPEFAFANSDPHGSSAPKGEPEIEARQESPAAVPDSLDSKAPAESCRKVNTIPDNEVDTVRNLSETMSDDEIAAHYQVSRSSVIRFRGKHEIAKSRGPRDGKTRWEYQWEPWQKQKLTEMKLAGHSYAEIGAAIGKTASQCSGMWFWEKKKLDACGPEQDTQTGQDESATTTSDYEQEAAERIENIRGLAAEGMTDKAIGEQLGHTAGYISQIRNANGIAPGSHQRKMHIDVPTDTLTSKHNGYAGKRDPGQDLQDSDWPDIEIMMNKQRRSVSQIASDYDVEFATMRGFIDRHQEHSSGEALAPSRSGA